MRKRIIDRNSSTGPVLLEKLDLNALATVWVSSEQAEHPAENAFDGQSGPGSTRWVAAEVGEQTFCVAFDKPQNLKALELEIEETGESRTQEIELAVSRDNGNKFEEILRQEYNFSPDGSTYEKEIWNLNVKDATHVRLRIRPDKGGRHGKASITSFALC